MLATAVFAARGPGNYPLDLGDVYVCLPDGTSRVVFCLVPTCRCRRMLPESSVDLEAKERKGGSQRQQHTEADLGTC